MNVSVLGTAFCQQFSKTDNLRQNCQQNTTATTETLTENQLRRNFALYLTFYLFIALLKILSHSKTIKNATELSVFGENDSRHLSNFLQTHNF